MQDLFASSMISNSPSLETLNGYVSVHGEQGTVDVLIIAYPITIDLP